MSTRRPESRDSSDPLKPRNLLIGAAIPVVIVGVAALVLLVL